mmetsp:Transcript_8949/g.13452  ORF Transcript_8949/g.13452 Transcript_8949/m.13452 type:complete len:141 (-) Transcript_8949:184-606(-)
MSDSTIAVICLYLIALHSLLSGYIYLFADFNFFAVDPAEFLWAAGALGNKLVYIAIIQFAVAFNIPKGSRTLLGFMLKMNIVMTVFDWLSTAVNGRYIASLAPTSASNELVAPYMTCIISLVGYYFWSTNMECNTTKDVK